MGGERDLVGDALLVGVTVGYALAPFARVVGSFGRARAGADGLWDAERSVFQLDVGVQGELPLAAGRDVFLVPFAGLGAGVRTRDFRDRRGRRDTDPIGYVAAGGRVDVAFATLAVTVRDYVCADDAPGSRTALRQDLAVFASAGVRF